MIALIDAEGRMVGRSLEPVALDRPAGADGSHPAAAPLRRRAAAAPRTPAFDGIARIAGFARARSVPWLVYRRHSDRCGARPGRRRTRAKAWLLGVAMLAIGLVLAALGSRAGSPGPCAS